ncbi:hypothetical protein OLZ31_23675 [Enterobacter asburiae]|nr:hypothetical protein [Enterobacter asburiae]
MQIKNDDEHERLLCHLENLLKKNPQPEDSEVDQEIEILVQPLSEYEDIHFPIVPIELEPGEQWRLGSSDNNFPDLTSLVE